MEVNWISCLVWNNFLIGRWDQLFRPELFDSTAKQINSKDNELKNLLSMNFFDSYHSLVLPPKWRLDQTLITSQSIMHSKS